MMCCQLLDVIDVLSAVGCQSCTVSSGMSVMCYHLLEFSDVLSVVESQ